MKHGKKYNECAKLVEKTKLYEIDEAMALAVKTKVAKFEMKITIQKESNI